MEVQLTGPIELRFELPETKKMKPSLLIELFKMAIEEVDDNTVTNANELFLRIKELDLNEDQINQIFSLSKIIYSHSVEPALKLDYFNFYSSHLTMKNVFAYLKSAKNADSETHVQKCLDYIKKMIGVKIDRIKDLLLVNIDKFKISWSEFSERIATLSEVWGGTLVISLTPDKSCKIEDVLGFLEDHGELVVSLDLTLYSNVVTDDFIKKAIGFSPSLNTLSIDSECIQGELDELRLESLVFGAHLLGDSIWESSDLINLNLAPNNSLNISLTDLSILFTNDKKEYSETQKLALLMYEKASEKRACSKDEDKQLDASLDILKNFIS